MRRVWMAVLLGGGASWAQTHVVQKPEAVVRAVAVYEWTGEEAKPTASRVVPVSVYINGELEDAGIYLARPVPFALDVGTVFDLEQAGETKGSVELAYARNYVVNSGPQFDDGWVAYGAFKPVAKPVLVAAKKSGELPQVVVSGGTRPHFSNKPDAKTDAKTDTDSGAKPVDRSGAAGAGTTVSAQDDPDRTKRRDQSDSDSAKDDPERATLKRRVPQTKEQQKEERKKKETASISGPAVSLNDDPDRPVLHRGTPGSKTDEESLPPLKGVPAEMRQMVAVSDAKDRPEHEFARAWESDAERSEVTAKLQELAREKVEAYGGAAAPVATPAAGKVPATRPRSEPARTAARTAARHMAAKAPVAAPVAFQNEMVRAYTLSYGGAPTYVYSASIAGGDGATRYVTIVAQREPLGSLNVALASVTDNRHLDRTPWLRLVDAVDAEASNRASLLFELRGQTARQFGLYRVIGAKAEQTFLTAVPE